MSLRLDNLLNVFRTILPLALIYPLAASAQLLNPPIADEELVEEELPPRYSIEIIVFEYAAGAAGGNEIFEPELPPEAEAQPDSADAEPHDVAENAADVEPEDPIVARLKKRVESMVDKIEVQLSDVQVKIGDKLHFLDKDMDGILSPEEMAEVLHQVLKRNISMEEAMEIASQIVSVGITLCRNMLNFDSVSLSHCAFVCVSITNVYNMCYNC